MGNPDPAIGVGYYDAKSATSSEGEGKGHMAFDNDLEKFRLIKMTENETTVSRLVGCGLIVPDAYLCSLSGMLMDTEILSGPICDRGNASRRCHQWTGIQVIEL